MKKISLIALLTPLILAVGYTEQPCAVDQTIYKYKCVNNSCFDTYIPRFKTVANAQLVGGVGKIPITFGGTVEFVAETGDVKVTVQFTDEKTNALAYRDNSLSCLDSKLIRYASDGYTAGTEYTNTITSTFDSANLYRQWSWTIKGADLKNVLVQDNTEPGYITFVGYFGLHFLVVDEVQVAYYFTFRVKVASDMSKSFGGSLQGLVEKDAATCLTQEICITRAETSVAFCAALGQCSSTATSQTLYLNQAFSILQKIINVGFEKFYLIPNSLTFTGDGLNRKANISKTIKTPGQTEIQTSVEFSYNAPITISVQSVLSQIPGRRMLGQSNRFLEIASGSMVSGALAQQTVSTNFYSYGSFMITVLSVILFIIF